MSIERGAPGEARTVGRILAALVFLVATSCAKTQQGGEAPPTSPSGSTPSSSTSLAELRYQGPEVAFDLPEGWHEFYLQIAMPFFAAYGPVSGGSKDYVMIAPVNEAIAGDTPQRILAALGIEGEDVTQVDVHGLPGYSVDVPASTGSGVEGQATLVVGEQGDYLVVCRFGSDPHGLVPPGCEALKSTLVEVPAPNISEPSGCTDTELALLQSVELPGGSAPGDPSVQGSGENRVCDLMVNALNKDGIPGDLVDFFTTQLRADGWHIMSSDVVEQKPLQKWRVLADRDWDYCMIEIYVDTQGTLIQRGATQDFFITVMDG